MRNMDLLRACVKAVSYTIIFLILLKIKEGNKAFQPGVVSQASNSALGRKREADVSEFKAILIYKMSSRAASCRWSFSVFWQ